jgi:hypothetical protein
MASGWTGISEGVDTGNDVEAKLTSAFTNIDADTVSAEGRLDAIENSGIVVLTGSNLVAQTISTSPTKVVFADSKPVEAGTGATGDIALNRATAGAIGVYKLRFEAFLDYTSNVDITWQIYKNGSPLGSGMTLSGQGATVFQVSLITSTTFIANDYIELYATASSSTDITIAQANGTLEKTYYQV